MNAFETRAAITAALILLTAVLGVVLTSTGRPINLFLSTIHKLVALASIVFAVLLVIDIYRSMGFAPVQPWLIVAAGLFFVGLLATGAILSSDKTATVALRAVHTVISFLAPASVLLLAYLRLRKGA